ncbi:MAG: hypothetical protein A0129_08030 [Limnobacter sp. CACIAM 66H1]|nr:MAG: hypothetical protein A0129_08030 [Limnobacter sp. CACIAM 66H1]
MVEIAFLLLKMLGLEKETFTPDYTAVFSHLLTTANCVTKNLRRASKRSMQARRQGELQQAIC